MTNNGKQPVWPHVYVYIWQQMCISQDLEDIKATSQRPGSNIGNAAQQHVCVSVKFKNRLKSKSNTQVVLPVYRLQLSLKCMEFDHEKSNLVLDFCKPYIQECVDVGFDLNLLQEHGGFVFDQIKLGLSIKIHCSYSVPCERTEFGSQIQMKV